jgi:hypothetical protein
MWLSMMTVVNAVVYSALLERVQPLLELVLFLLGELRGSVAAAAAGSAGVGGSGSGRVTMDTDSQQGSWLGLQVIQQSAMISWCAVYCVCHHMGRH